MELLSDSLHIRVAGALSGTVFVSGDATVAHLRQEVARLMTGDVNPASIKLIVNGRSLLDDSLSLAQCGIGPRSRVLVVGRGAAASGPPPSASANPGAAGGGGQGAGGGLGQGVDEAARVAQLERIRRAMDSMAARNAGVVDTGYAFDLENQAGERLVLSEGERRALVMGLALHDMGKAAMDKGDWAGALDRLRLAEAALDQAPPGLLQGTDNRGLLLLDTVWCCYKLGDVRRLAVARDKLVAARAALTQAHGAGLERVRRLHGSRFCPELAVYVRLEALEGVVAFMVGDLDAAERALGAAHRKWLALQVADHQLAQLQDMGFGAQEAVRALRFSGGEVEPALAFITQQRAARQEREERQQRDQAWRKERQQYGRCPAGDYVQLELLTRMCDLGYDRRVAAEALRSLDNNWSAALEALLQPASHAALALAASLQQALAQVPAAPKRTRRRRQRRQDETSSGVTVGQVNAGAENGSNDGHTNEAASTAGPGSLTVEQPAMPNDAGEGGGSSESEASDSGGAGHRKSDEEVEAEAVGSLRRDPMAGYDIDVRDEGELCETYLALCASSRAKTV